MSTSNGRSHSSKLARDFEARKVKPPTGCGLRDLRVLAEPVPDRIKPGPGRTCAAATPPPWEILQPRYGNALLRTWTGRFAGWLPRY